MEKSKKRKINVTDIVLYSILILIIILLIIYICINNKNKYVETEKPTIIDSKGFNNTIIHEFNKNSENKNYMISPYSLEVVLAMLRDGAEGGTYQELVNLIGTRSIESFYAKERINIANGLFIKQGFNVNDEYKNIVSKNYNSEVIYDRFENPNVINNWVKEKTFGMIPKAMDEVSKDFVMAIGNAVAIDVKWKSAFKCVNTKVKKFNTLDNDTVNVAMMHNSYENGTAYYEDDNATYVSIPYLTYDEDGNIANKGVSLEFIGILPDENVNEFISTYNFNDLGNILSKMEVANEELTVNVDLPRFKFNNDFNNLSDMLKDLGLKETLGSNPKFTKITNESVFISNFIHKTFIDLNEAGTKAAAVTLATFDKNSIVTTKPKEVNISFDKPFVYLIKDKNSNEILFFGVIYEPDEYNSITCEEEK